MYVSFKKCWTKTKLNPYIGILVNKNYCLTKASVSGTNLINVLDRESETA